MIKRILVIDDERAIGRGIVHAFNETDFQIDIATTGNKGLEMVEDRHYDMIFLDISLPDINGVEVLRKLRRKNKHLPVYLITAFYKEFSSTLKKAEKEGLDFEILQKPFYPEDIVMIAKTILKKAKVSQKNNNEKWEFKFYVAGQTEKSLTVADLLKSCLDDMLENQYSLEVIDLLLNPELAVVDNIFATPTFLKTEPLPIMSVIGNLNNRQKMTDWLNLAIS